MADPGLRPFVRTSNVAAFHVQRDLALIVVAVAALAVPFVAQPFHMDDNFYLDMARNVRLQPLFPNDTPYVFEGRFLHDMGSHSHPPLHTYFLALILRIAGEAPGKEWVFHLCALIFPLIAAVSAYFISAHFLERPLWPALVLACTPVFLVMQHTLMTDIPTLAWWLAAIAFFLAGVDRRRIGWLGASSVCQFAAMFTSYQSVALTPLLAFYQWRRRGRAAGWGALALPIIVMAAWFGISSAHYGRFLLNDTAGYIASRNTHVPALLWTKLVALLEYQGWLVVFPLFLLYTLGRGLRGRFAALVVLSSAYLVQLTVPHYRLMDKVIFVAGLAAGLTVMVRLGLFAASAFRDPESTGFGSVEAQFLCLWYFGVAAYCLLLFTEGSARYVLPLVLPLLIYFFRHLEIIEVSEYRAPSKPFLNAAMVASGSLVVTLVWGMLLSHADQEFARVYPRAAGEFARVSDGMKSFFAGEWGFRYYFRQSGARQLPVDESAVQGGDWLGRPRLALPYDVPADLWSMTVPVQTLSYELKTPIRLLDWQSPAGFYSTSWGLVPFSLSRKSLELVEVRQVNYLVERLPFARVETGSVTPPWPGFLELQGSAPLALLAKADSRVTYPWNAAEMLFLDLKLGIAPDSYSEGEDNPVAFRITQRNAVGETVAGTVKTLNPGMRRNDRHWTDLQVPLQSGTGELELEVSGRRVGRGVTAAFAHALLRAAQ